MSTMSPNEPLVSIIIPVYNGSDYLAEAIDSALSQTYQNIEIIVINDGSCDEGKTEQIALSYGEKIRYFKKKNGGVSSALNFGIEKMRGEYISWLSHDDLYLPDKVSDQVKALNSAGTYVVLSRSYQIDAKGHRLQNINKRRKLESGYYTWHDALNILFERGSYNGCSLLIPKRAVELCGGFNENLRYVQDMLMWAMIFLYRFDLVVLDQVGVCSRVHGNQLTQKGRSLFHRESNVMSGILFPLLQKTDKHASKLMYSYIRYNAIMNNPPVVREGLKISKTDRLLSFNKRIKIRMLHMYGSVRPIIRKIYYRLFRNIKTT